MRRLANSGIRVAAFGLVAERNVVSRPQRETARRETDRRRANEARPTDVSNGDPPPVMLWGEDEG